MVVFTHPIPKRCYRTEPKTAPVWAFASKGTVGPKPVVIMPPFRQEIFQAGGSKIDGRVKPFQVRFPGTFGLPVKVGLPGLSGRNFMPYPISRRRTFSARNPTPRSIRIRCTGNGGCSTTLFFVDLERPVARTVVYCRVPVQIRGCFTRVHPYPLARNRAAAAYIFRLLPGRFGKGLAVVPP